MKQPLSNPLRQAFADSKPAGPHPDAGLLAAFAEGALTTRERESTLAHLATCAECREVLGVAGQAAPQVAATQPQLVVRPVRPPLWSWLPWVASAAAVVVVCSAVLLRDLPKRAYQPADTIATMSRAEEKKSEQEKTGAVEEKTRAADKAVPSQRLEGAIRSDTTSAGESWTASDKAAQIPPSQTQALQAGAQMKALKEKDALKDESSEAVRGAARKAAPSPAESGWVGGNADLRQQRDSNAYSNNQAAANQMRVNQAPLSANNQYDQMRPSTAKSAPSQVEVQAQAQSVDTSRAEVQENSMSGAAAAPAMAPPALQKTMRTKAALEAAVRPHWRIDSNGRLQRSFGNGVWQPVLATEPARFHVVAVMGSELWAGGENARLYHSTDDGANWQAVALPKKNGTTHNLTRIYFQTPQAGTVESEDGAAWFTTDGGKSWK